VLGTQFARDSESLTSVLECKLLRPGDTSRPGVRSLERDVEDIASAAAGKRGWRFVSMFQETATNGREFHKMARKRGAKKARKGSVERRRQKKKKKEIGTLTYMGKEKDS